MSEKYEKSAIILAAGFSKRMKSAKFSLMFDEKRTFLEKIIGEYLNFGCREIITVMNPEGIKLKKELNLIFPENVKFVLNDFPDKGRFFSLQTAVRNLTNSTLCFIQNIDNPFVSQKILKVLEQNSGKGDYIIPSFKNKGGHPVLISVKIIEAVKNNPDENINMKTFFNSYAKKYIPTENEKILANINTISDYHFYF